MPDFTNIPNPTNAQLLALARNEYAKALQAFSVGRGDRRLERQQIDKLRDQIVWLAEQVAAENGTSSNGGVVYAGFTPIQ